VLRHLVAVRHLGDAQRDGVLVAQWSAIPGDGERDLLELALGCSEQ
jgi:hypothetical protein